MEGGRDRLDRQYASGEWDYLAGLSELSRFSVVVGYCRFLKPQGAVLEIGCGEGILAERLEPATLGRYVGVDLSSEAVRRAAGRDLPNTTFVAAEASTLDPGTGFDLIVFNECMEYFDAPLGVLQRYENYLSPNGLFIVSIFDGLETARSEKIWRMLTGRYETIAVTQVVNEQRYAWSIKVLRPPAPHA